MQLHQILPYSRLCFWFVVIFASLCARTQFIFQTCSRALLWIWLVNQLFSLFLCYRARYSRTINRCLLVLLPFVTLSTLIVYAIYLRTVSYRLRDLFTLNMMATDRNASLLSTALNYYQCCRMQDEILFDSVDEREYFRRFPFCAQTIDEHESQPSHWARIKTCGPLLRVLVWTVRFVALVDLVLYMLIILVTFLCPSRTNDANSKVK